MDSKMLFEKVQRGEIKTIAKLTGYSYQSVWAQLKGIRTLKPKVQQATELVIAVREESLKKLQEQINHEA